MSSLKKVLTLCLPALITLSCSKHDNPPSVMIGEMPMSSVVDAKEISIYKFDGASNGAAIGIELKIKADGYVTGLGCAVPAIGHYVLTIFKVDSVNKIGTQIAKLPIDFAATDTANFKFKYVYLSSKISVSKNNYYRVAVNGDFSSYDYMTFPAGSKYALPLGSPTDSKIILTKGVSGYSMLYPDTEFTSYMFPADVVIQFP